MDRPYPVEMAMLDCYIVSGNREMSYYMVGRIKCLLEFSDLDFKEQNIITMELLEKLEVFKERAQGAKVEE